MYDISLNFKKINFRKIFVLFNIIFLIFSVLFCIKIYIVDDYLHDISLKDARKIIYDQNETTNVSEKLKSLTEQNSDIVGWISIKGTPVDYPVLQSSFEDPVFYLNHDSNKKKNANGSVFMNASRKFSKSIRNVVLHAHNLKSGRMFGSILKYSSIKFYKSAPIISFDTIYGPEEYKIFAIFKTNTDEKHGKIFNYLRPVFNGDEDFLEFLYNIKIRSLLNIPVDLNAKDKLIILSTCSYEMPNFRTVVVARKIRDGEDKNIDTEKVTLNPTSLWPEAYHQYKKTEIPKHDGFFEDLKNGKIDWLTKK
ncbi:MAG: class B sortase [Candidatus Improbicoccus pseudotrichonymphae]|uniref:Class B sortase n=1 Tax=Candidatus Improbicoccus pseudotrichonymphae TaxID=3033792 RepID=A0AA48KZF7_9FIRM|nr:MAG: class B sortase [Candidatus Improbicoccus pseudotrichonymphae]